MTHLQNVALWIISALLLVALGTSGYREYTNYKNKTELNTKIEGISNDLNQASSTIRELEEKKIELEETLSNKEDEIFDFKKEIKKLTKTNSELQKTLETDKELLAKYSKIYFLNENYKPISLDKIPKKYTLNPDKELEIHSKVSSFLEDMINEAEDDEIKLKIVSGYRSFDEQKILKSNYAIKYGSGANTFSADQGYSEHQIGTTLDITSETMGSGLSVTFENDPAYIWLTKNAYKYGFVLSYPKNNQFYQFEPWHWRFVGTDLSRKLHKTNKNFYDLDQREINEYLGEIFD